MDEGALYRYWRVLEGTEKARYLESKEIAVDTALDSSDEELIRVHDEALKEPTPRTEGPSLLEVKTEIARRGLSSCELCERKCRVDRASGETGHCRVLDARISSEFIHMGEEPELVPSYTIFFAGCTFDCIYCQNSDISTNPGAGVTITPIRLARMIDAQALCTPTGRPSIHGANRVRNVNWVGGDPTSNIHYVLQTISECEANLPQVWNSNMYLTQRTMSLLKGVIDVYLTDFKYGNDACAERLSNVKGYTGVVRRNHLLARDDAEVIVRHLVLPNHVECCTRSVLTWIADNLEDVKVNVMGQYRPCHMAGGYDDLSRSLEPDEYKRALIIAYDLGLDLTL